MPDDLERRLQSLGDLGVPPPPPVAGLRRRRPVGWWVLSAAAVVVLLVIGVLALDDGDDRVALVQTTNPSTTEGISTSTSTSDTTTADPIDSSRPPAVVVEGGGTTLELEPWTFCWTNLCADGVPPEEPPDVGDAAAVAVEFPIEGWEFEARFASAGEDCGREYPGTLTREGSTSFQLAPHGPAGTYDVTLAGRGGDGASQGGDLFVTFRWTTTTGGPLPEPSATTSILADNGGRVDSYGVELGASNLGITPTTATVSVVVTAASGATVTLDLTRTPAPRCGDGSVSFRDAPELGLQAAALGPPPFRYDVTLVLDGVAYEATATWPDDVDVECSPCVPLEFDPPLPSLND